MSTMNTAGRVMDRKDLARFFGKVRVAPNGCWEWIGAITDCNYGCFRFGRVTPVHRVSHRWFVGAIPDGYEVDHLCFNKRCVCPWHLEAVTRQENHTRWAATLTHCKHGHPRTPANIRVSVSGRYIRRRCLPCARAEGSRRYIAQLQRTA